MISGCKIKYLIKDIHVENYKSSPLTTFLPSTIMTFKRSYKLQLARLYFKSNCAIVVLVSLLM